jgi:hypothetical protein
MPHVAEARRDAVRAEGCRGRLLHVASALEQACAHHASAAALTSSPSARPRSRSLKLFPPEYVRILYCTPTGWTPGAKGFAGAACAAASDYHVLVPSEGEWSGLLSGRGSTCPYPQPPAGLAKDHIRVALTAQGVRYAVLAQVGTSEATPAFRLSAPSLEQGSISRPRLSLARGGRRGLVLDGIVNIGGLISHLF